MNNDNLSNTLILSDDDLNHATNYYYKKATKEIKEFTKCTKYETIDGSTVLSTKTKYIQGHSTKLLLPEGTMV